MVIIQIFGCERERVSGAPVALLVPPAAPAEGSARAHRSGLQETYILDGVRLLFLAKLLQPDGPNVSDGS